MNKHLFSVALLLSTLNACASEQPAASADAAATLACADTPQIGHKHHKAGATRRTHNNDEDSAKSASQSFREQEEDPTGSSTASSGHASPAPQAVNPEFAAAPSSDSATADDTVVTAAEALAALETSALPETAPKTDAETTLAAAGKRTPSPTAPAGTPADGEIDLDAHDAQDPKTEKVD